MSFLDDIKKFSSNKTLKNVETRVQFEDGRIVRERKSDTGIFVTSSCNPEQGHGFVVDLKPDLQIGIILPGITLGSQDVAHDEDLLEKHRITHILDCSGATTSINNKRTIVYKSVQILDLPDTKIQSYFEECFNFISLGSERGCILVHCNAGVSRSATIVIAYLMNKFKIRFKLAFEKVKEARPSICPNPGFIEQLKEYDKSLFQYSTNS